MAFLRAAPGIARQCKKSGQGSRKKKTRESALSQYVLDFPFILYNAQRVFQVGAQIFHILNSR
jgi:hypothetical protein